MTLKKPPTIHKRHFYGVWTFTSEPLLYCYICRLDPLQDLMQDLQFTASYTENYWLCQLYWILMWTLNAPVCKAGHELWSNQHSSCSGKKIYWICHFISKMWICCLMKIHLHSGQHDNEKEAFHSENGDVGKRLEIAKSSSFCIWFCFVKD